MKKKISLLLVIIFIILIISFFIVNYIDKKISPIIMDYSKSEIKKIASIIINRSIRDNLLDDGILDELFIVGKDNNEITSVTLDSVIVNKITNRISDACEDNLRLIEKGEYNKLRDEFNLGKEYFLVPSGVIFTNSILSNIGPKIPINLKIIGNVTSGVKADVKEYGINNSLITISVEISVELMVILPLSSDYVSITNYVPIMVKLVQGEVPDIYGGSLIK